MHNELEPGISVVVPCFDGSRTLDELVRRLGEVLGGDGGRFELLLVDDGSTDDSWETIRTTLSTQMRTATCLRGEGGEQIHIRKSNYPNDAQQVLLRALRLSWNPGNTQKTIVAP